MVDISSVLPNTTPQAPAQPSSAKGAEATQVRNSQVIEQPVKVPAVEERPDIRTSEDKRYNRVLEGAKQMRANIYVVGDTRFTIFKDGSGQYITRFTNLRDGSVSYFPEPEIQRYMEARGLARQAFYELDA